MKIKIIANKPPNLATYNDMIQAKIACERANVEVPIHIIEYFKKVKENSSIILYKEDLPILEGDSNSEHIIELPIEEGIKHLQITINLEN